MKKHISLLTIVLMLMTMGYASFAFGAVSAEEASKLDGPVLTPIGAERAGNKDGTIPAWTGVPIPIPKGYKPGSGVYVDPFADEKPLFSINQKNMAQYADKLAEGVKVMMKRYPDYRIDVYPTHRTAVYLQSIYDNTKRCATVCQIKNDGRSITGTGCRGCTPFPITKSGHEALYNHQLASASTTYINHLEAHNITRTGKVSLSMQAIMINYLPWYDMTKEKDPRARVCHVIYVGPPRRNGEGVIYQNPIDWYKTGSVIWQYLPAQRRVRLAPDFCCDTPNQGTAGANTWDDANMFQGDPERYNWKLIGKKEMYIPYNTYKFTFWHGDLDKALLGRYANPDLIRWELHRVWVLEATLKPGKRHIYGKRILYLDEDTWGGIMADNFDKRGELYRLSVNYPTYSYDKNSFFLDFNVYYDFIADVYATYRWPRMKAGLIQVENFPDSKFSPDAMAGGGLR